MKCSLEKMAGLRGGYSRISLGWRHRVSPAGLPIEQVLEEYSLS